MKKIFFISVLFLSTFFVSASDYKVVNNKVVKIEKSTTLKKDSVFFIKDNITFYKGSKGGIYYYKISKKTNKPYKVYLKQN